MTDAKVFKGKGGLVHLWVNMRSEGCKGATLDCKVSSGTGSFSRAYWIQCLTAVWNSSCYL